MLPKIDFPQYDLSLSRLGLGTVKFGRNTGVKYPESFVLPTMVELKNVLSVAKALGINTLDTAPSYGSSEERLGQLLKNQRQDWIIVGKAGEQFVNDHSHFDFRERAIIESVEASLKRLQTDYLDMLLIHSSGEDEKIIHTYEVFNTLEKLKKAGKIRLGGMSTKTVEGGLLTVRHADVVMATYQEAYPDERPVIEAASAAKKIVLLKKVLGSGHLTVQKKGEDPVLRAMKFVFSVPGVASVIVGSINPLHLKHNVECVLKAFEDTKA